MIELTCLPPEEQDLIRRAARWKGMTPRELFAELRARQVAGYLAALDAADRERLAELELPPPGPGAGRRLGVFASEDAIPTLRLSPLCSEGGLETMRARQR